MRAVLPPKKHFPSRLQIDTLKAPPYDRPHNATEEFPSRD
jgi:hypothetical protein